MAVHTRTGVWLIGARGGVATSVALGLAALRRGLCESLGLVTASPACAQADLVIWNDLVLGGHEIRHTSLFNAASELLAQVPSIGHERLHKCRADLDEIDTRIRPGALQNCGSAISGLASAPGVIPDQSSPRETIAHLQDDLRQFQQQAAVERVIVVNLASTEPAADDGLLSLEGDSVEGILGAAGARQLPASSLYAIAALDLGMPYINFTPSVGCGLPAIDRLAVRRGVCYAGKDGKTGETLLKSVLSPMFRSRNLKIMSWVGHNIFGNLDGIVLDRPENKQSKIMSKDQVLRQVLGYDPQTLVSIEYIASLGDWKTAWDHVHFLGFLGTPMTMQITWQGCDSMLAAPLVIDLVRLVDLAARRGETGALGFLASFFKSPIGTNEHDFFRQFAMLEDWLHNDPVEQRAQER